MSYSDLDRRPYSVPVNDVCSIRGPKGKAGRLLDWHVSPTTTFTAGTIKIGTVANDDAFASVVFGALADQDTACGSDGTTDTDWLIDAVIPADTEVLVTAANGGAGAGEAMIIIGWAW